MRAPFLDSADSPIVHRACWTVPAGSAGPRSRRRQISAVAMTPLVQQGADPWQCGEAGAVVDGHAAEPGTQGIAEVERGDVETGRHALAGAMGFLQHPHLQRWHGGEAGGAEQSNEDDHGDLVLQRKTHQPHDHCQCHQAAKQGGYQPAVGQLAAEQVAQHQAAAEHQQHRRHGALGETGKAGQQRRHVAEHGEHAAETEHGGQQTKQHGRALQHAEIVAQVAGRRRGAVARQVDRQNRQGQHSDAGHHPEGRTPAIELAEPGAQRDAEDGGDGQAGEHQGDGRGAALGRHQAGGDHRADAEEGAVGEGGQHPRGHQRGVVRCQGTGQVAEGEDHHQPQQRAALRPARGEGGEQRRAEHHAQGVAGDQQAGSGDRHAEVLADLQQQSHDHEFGNADAKGTGGQGIQGNGHDGSPWLICINSEEWAPPYPRAYC